MDRKDFHYCFSIGQEIVHSIERVKTTTDDEPVKVVILTACGELKVDKPFTISDNPYDVSLRKFVMKLNSRIFSLFSGHGLGKSISSPSNNVFHHSVDFSVFH